MVVGDKLLLVMSAAAATEEVDHALNIQLSLQWLQRSLTARYLGNPGGNPRDFLQVRLRGGGGNY